MNTLEASLRRLTQPVNGQFPRPWMTDMEHPEKARIFIVGYNQATGFPAAALVGGRNAYIDALFNRNGMSCRKLYEQMRYNKGRSNSKTRENVVALRGRLVQGSGTTSEAIAQHGWRSAGSCSTTNTPRKQT